MASAMCHQLYNLQALETPLPGTTDVALAQAEEMATKREATPTGKERHSGYMGKGLFLAKCTSELVYELAVNSSIQRLPSERLFQNVYCFK